LNNRMIVLIITISFSCSVSNSAAAAIQDDVNLCRGVLMAEIREKYDGATLKTNSISGTVLVRIKFQMTFNDQRYIVICKLRRGKIIETIWPDNLELGREESVARQGAAIAAT